MFNQISGVPDWKTKETRGQVTLARLDYNKSLERLHVVKDKYRALKKANGRERDKLIREEKMKEMFKFTGMKKKIDFLP